MLVASFLLYKSETRQKIEYCSHIIDRGDQSLLFSFDRVQYQLPNLMRKNLVSTLQPLSHKLNVLPYQFTYSRDEY